MQNLPNQDIAILGGGAAGLAAAIAAKRAAPALRVAIFERGERVGKKLLATGNGRCNLSHTGVTAAAYQTGSRGVLANMLGLLPAQRVIDFFEDIGLLCTVQKDGLVYPYSYQASMVLDVLRAETERLGVAVYTGFTAENLLPGNGGFEMQSNDGQRTGAQTVILAAGGKAAPQLGGGDSGYEIAMRLGHSVAPLYPGLVPVKTVFGAAKALKGIRVKCAVSLFKDDALFAGSEGEVQFTDFGLSGIPVMQLSNLLGAAPQNAKWVFSLDLFPAWEGEALRALIRQRCRANPSAPLAMLLLGTVHKRLAQAVLAAALPLPLSAPCSALAEKDIASIAQMLKDWRMPFAGTTGFSKAQVTGGGVPLTEIEVDTCESKCCRGLYIIGETLDATGDCGGYNLHWAFGTGLLAGQAGAGALPHT